MKRDWNVVREILEQIEEKQLTSFVKAGQFLNTPGSESADDCFGHMEILIDAGIVKHATVQRNASGEFEYWDFRGVLITMQGHDLLDSLRDDKVWTQIKTRAQKAGVSLTWEFIKASIPIVIGEIAKSI